MQETFENALLHWYAQNARALPWRENKNPYYIWVSEIMLQQTRVEAVKPYFLRFIKAFPNIASLANAEEEQYLKLWEGLGYYSRVRNLHKGAVQIMEHYRGQMPNSYAELLNIAGIGPYTAAAIASIAFNEKAPAIDGNLLRLFARLTCYPCSVKEDHAKQIAKAYFSERMQSDFGSFNQALMDLGASVCLPNSAPKCELCPLQTHCGAFANNTTLQYPVIPPKKERKIEQLTILLLHDKDCVAVQKRPAKGLLAGLYEFPYIEGHISITEAKQKVQALGLSILRIQKIQNAKHIFTHKEWHMQAYDIFIEHTDEDTLQFVNAKKILHTLAFPSALRSYTEYFIDLYK